MELTRHEKPSRTTLPADNPAPMKRLEFLDSLRGLAACYVILHHVPLILHPQLPIPELVEPFIMYGWTGVELFFAISAFSLCLTMPRHEKYKYPTVSYAIARLFRIVPLFYILILYNILYKWFVWGAWPDPITTFLNLSFIFNLFPSYAWSMVGAGWTVGVEMLFYVTFPILYFRLPTLWQRIGCVFAMLIASKVAMYFILPLITDPKVGTDYVGISIATHFPTFVLGMMAFSIYDSLNLHKHRTRTGLCLLVAGLCFLFYLTGNPYSFPIVPWPQPPGFAYLLILVGLSLCPWPALVNRVTQFYGRISYSTYLWHAPVIFLLEPSLHRVYDFGFSDGASLTICYVLVFASVTVVAELSYFYIELPGMRLGKYIKERLASARLPQAGAVPL